MPKASDDCEVRSLRAGNSVRYGISQINGARDFVPHLSRGALQDKKLRVARSG